MLWDVSITLHKVIINVNGKIGYRTGFLLKILLVLRNVYTILEQYCKIKITEYSLSDRIKNLSNKQNYVSY